MGHKKFVAAIVTSHLVTAGLGLLFGFILGVGFLFEKAEVPFQFWWRILTS